MDNIRVVDFSTGAETTKEPCVEHVKFDDSGDHLYVNNDVVDLFCSERNKTIGLVRIDQLDNLIRALNYIRDNHS